MPEIQSELEPTLIILFPLQLQKVEAPALSTNCVELLPVKLPSVSTHNVPTFEIFTAFPDELVPLMVTSSKQEAKPSSLMSYKENSTGPFTGELKFIVTVIVLIPLFVQSVLNNKP